MPLLCLRHLLLKLFDVLFFNGNLMRQQRDNSGNPEELIATLIFAEVIMWIAPFGSED